MLDINLLREKPKLVKNSEKKRGNDVKLVDEVLLLDEKWKKELKAMEIIPKTLAENAGLDPIDILTELRSRHELRLVREGIIKDEKYDINTGKKTSLMKEIVGDEKPYYFGVNVYTGRIENMKKLGVIEPLKIKTQAIKSAAEAAEMILRIDDIISAGKLGKEGMPPMPQYRLSYNRRSCFHSVSVKDVSCL